MYVAKDTDSKLAQNVLAGGCTATGRASSSLLTSSAAECEAEPVGAAFLRGLEDEEPQRPHLRFPSRPVLRAGGRRTGALSLRFHCSLCFAAATSVQKL